MNTKTLIIAVVLLVAAAGGYYLVTNNQSSSPAMVGNDDGPNQPETAENTFTGKKGMGSLMGLMGFGQNTMCTFSYVDSSTGQTSSGEFYYDGGNQKFRVDSSTQADGAVYVTHMINDGDFAYVWSEGEEENFAMKMSADMSGDANTQDYDSSEPNKPVSMDQEVEYDCNSWRVDNSMFIPPSSIEFMDMASMMQAAMEGMPEGFSLPEGFPGQ